MSETAKNGTPKPAPAAFQFGVRYSLGGKRTLETAANLDEAVAILKATNVRLYASQNGVELPGAGERTSARVKLLDAVAGYKAETKGYGLFSFDSSPWGREFTANWAHGDGQSKRDYLLLFHARILMTFFREWFNAAPILEATGEQGSGKTLTFEKIGWLFYGPKYESSNLPKDKRSFIAAVTNSALCVFDEAEGFNFEKHEIMGLTNKIPFGGYEEIAVLCMNNVIRKLKLRSHVAFIGRDLLF